LRCALPPPAVSLLVDLVLGVGEGGLIAAAPADAEVVGVLAVLVA
jgi:hypothetical protein